MFDSETFTQDMLANPARLTAAALDAMENADTTGSGISINDPNNGFTMMMAANMYVFANFSQRIDNYNSFQYAQRARNAEQLYRHLSEFDYVQLMAAPAPLPFVFAMNKDWIVANAVRFDDNYNKIQIPSTSYITVGGTIYSMYYPIDIFVNRITGAVSAFYNTDETNSLHSLTTNMLLDVQEYTQNGLNYFHIQFNMYQFERAITTYTVSAEQGFSKTLIVPDQFYAAKVFYLSTNGIWTELEYSLDKKYYDYTKPTVLLTVMNDVGKLKLEIPQIYFDNRQISQNIKIELYTTRGAVNYSIGLADVQGLRANFDPTSSEFASPLAQMPTWILVPAQTDVVGGSDAMDFAKMREAVLNQELYNRVPVTPPELTAAFKKQGFSLARHIDDLTDRMYFASNTLVDGNNMVIPTFTGSILLADEALTGDPSTIINFSDGYYTLLPTTVFAINSTSTTCVPLTDGELSILNGLTHSRLVTELNTGKYVRQPFHITLLTSKKSPAAAIYNLLSPTLKSLKFIAENPHSAAQMSVVSSVVTHLNDGTGGYQIRMSVSRSANIADAALGSYKLIFTCRTKVGDLAYFPASYQGADTSGNDVWEILLTTNYHITSDDHITVMMYNLDDHLVPVEISLKQSFRILSAFLKAQDPTIIVDTALNALLPTSLRTSLVVMSHQEASYTFGTNMSDEIYCGVNTSWGNDVYDVATADEYFVTNQPIFQTNEQGVIEARWNSTTSAMEVVVIHPTGSTPPTTSDLVVKTTAVGAVTSQPALITVASTAGILPGMAIRGQNIPTSSKVTAVNGLVLTLSAPLTTAVVSGTELTITNTSPKHRTTVTQTSASATIRIADTSDILVGHRVFGLGIAPGTTVESITNATTVVLSTLPTKALPSGTLVSFVNMTAPGVVRIAKGSIKTDGTGAPLIVKSAQNQYRIPTVLFDGRLFSSQDSIDQTMVKGISQRLQDYSSRVTSIENSLMEISEVYYKPARTMGNAVFGTGNNETQLLSLEMSVKVVVYVDEAIYNTHTTTEAMTKTIYSIINTQIQLDTISLSDIGDAIKSALGIDVIAVEVSDLNGDPNLRLVALEESGCAPSIAHTLVLNSDLTISRHPAISVEFVSRPATIEGVITGAL